MFDKNLFLNSVSTGASKKTVNEAMRRTNKERAIFDLFQDVHGIPYTANSGMHFVSHFAEHPVHGKLYVGRNGILTNNPKKAQPQGAGAEVIGNATRSDRVPLQPRFNINGKRVEYGSDLHKNLAGWLKENPKEHVEPRLSFSRERTEQLADAENAKQAEAKIMNQRPTFQVRANPDGNRAKLRRMEERDRNS